MLTFYIFCRLKNPCVKNPGGGDQCAPPFGFRHQQSISSDLDKFRTAVESTKISGNIDSPEGGFDALMQIAVCSVSNILTRTNIFVRSITFYGKSCSCISVYILKYLWN